MRYGYVAVMLTLISVMGCGGSDSAGTTVGADVPVSGVWVGAADGWLIYFEADQDQETLTAKLSYPDEFLGAALTGTVKNGRVALTGDEKDLTFDGVVTADARISGRFRMYYESNSGPYTEEKGDWWVDVWPGGQLGEPEETTDFISMSAYLAVTPDAQRFWVSRPFGGLVAYDADFVETEEGIEGDFETAIATDGTTLWQVTSSGIAPIGDSTLTSIALDFSPQGLAFDGEQFWSCDGAGSAYRFDRDGVVSRTISVPQSFVCDTLAHDGTNLWALIETYVVAVDATTGERLAAYDTDSTSTAGMAIAGGKLWLLERYGDLKQFALPELN